MVYKRLERILIQLDTVDSTNDYASDLIKSSFVKNGTTVLTDHQRLGRGQRSAIWTTEVGKNLTCSTIIFPNLDASRVFFLNIIASLAIRKCLSDLGINSKIKWPNDILVREKKICGILVENIISGGKINSAIIGVGLNVNQKDFDEAFNATSLSIEKNKDFEVSDIFNQYFGYLDFYLNLLCESNFDLLKKHYYEHFYRFGEKKMFRTQLEEFEATVLGIADSGLLLLEVKGKKETFDIKEIKFL